MSFHIRLSLNFIWFYIRLYIILLSTFSKLFARFVYIYFVAKKYNFSFLFLKFISLIIRMAPCNQAVDSNTQAQWSCKEVYISELRLWVQYILYTITRIIFSDIVDRKGHIRVKQLARILKKLPKITQNFGWSVEI
jgi:hypothetical protein